MNYFDKILSQAKHPFYKSMTREQKNALLDVREVCKDVPVKFYPSGTRYYNRRSVTTTSDWDIVTILSDAAARRLTLANNLKDFTKWIKREESSLIADSPDGTCLYKHEVNLIVFYPEFRLKFEKFMAATRFCAILDMFSPINYILGNKDNRVKIFEAFKNQKTFRDMFVSLPANIKDWASVSIKQAFCSVFGEMWDLTGFIDVEDHINFLVLADHLEEEEDPHCEWIRCMVYHLRPQYQAIHC